MSDEGLHELRLNGKQMVFLFMIATVVAVVTFLCGVMVGRGVPAAQAAELVATTVGTIDPTASAGVSRQGAPSAAARQGENDPTAPAEEDLSYFDRLESPDAPFETLKDAATLEREEAAAATAGRTSTPAPPVARVAPVESRSPAGAAAKTASPASTPALPSGPAVSPTPPAPDSALTAVPSEPAGTGYVVQVAATRIRRDADSIARRLAGKGYSAFVSAPAGKQRMYRVRVGKFDERHEADTVAGRLEREEQFKPWVTR